MATSVGLEPTVTSQLSPVFKTGSLPIRIRCHKSSRPNYNISSICSIKRLILYIFAVRAYRRFRVKVATNSVKLRLWSQGRDSNPQPLGYEPSEQPLLYPAINGRDTESRTRNNPCEGLRLIRPWL